MKRIAFHVYHFSFRGTEVATYDYALYNEKILANKSIIVCPVDYNTENSCVLAKEKFTDSFTVFYYSDIKQLEDICDREKVDLLYVMKYGKRDNVVSLRIKTAVHCVFTTSENHGHVYAGVSNSVARHNENSVLYPVVNHIVWLPHISSDYRSQLGIPSNAVVFGRHGGRDTFNIPFVTECIKKILDIRSDVWFLFCIKPDIMNITHPRVVYIDTPFVDCRVKRKFINTCDAMIHASLLGESFGLSVMEFSYCNKPVVTWCGGLWHKQHIHTLGDKCIKYDSETELCDILYNFDKEEVKLKDWNVTADFSPRIVMTEFDKVFLKS